MLALAFALLIQADPLAGLDREVSAVLDLSTDPRLLIVQTAHGVSASRILRVGDEYRDGWRLTGFVGLDIRLTNGAEERLVRLPTRVVTVGVEPAIIPADLSGFTNAATPLPTTFKPASVAEAISLGDPEAVQDLHGTSADVLEALTQRRRNEGADAEQLDSLVLVANLARADGGRLVGIRGPGGRAMVLRTPPKGGPSWLVAPDGEVHLVEDIDRDLPPLIDRF